MEEDYKALEKYFAERELLRKKQILEDKKLREEAISFYEKHTFILGDAVGFESEIDEIVRYVCKLKSLERKYGFEFRAIVWDGKIVAIPNRDFSVYFSISLKKLLRRAKFYRDESDEVVKSWEQGLAQLAFEHPVIYKKVKNIDLWKIYNTMLSLEIDVITVKLGKTSNLFFYKDGEVHVLNKSPKGMVLQLKDVVLRL